jgi:hypothetical protein
MYVDKAVSDTAAFPVQIRGHAHRWKKRRKLRIIIVSVQQHSGFGTIIEH